MKTSSPSVINIGSLRLKKSTSHHQGKDPSSGIAVYTSYKRYGRYDINIELTQYRDDRWLASGQVENVNTNDTIAENMLEGSSPEDAIDNLCSDLGHKIDSEIQSLTRVFDALNYV